MIILRIEIFFSKIPSSISFEFYSEIFPKISTRNSWKKKLSCIYSCLPAKIASKIAPLFLWLIKKFFQSFLKFFKKCFNGYFFLEIGVGVPSKIDIISSNIPWVPLEMPSKFHLEVFQKFLRKLSKDTLINLQKIPPENLLWISSKANAWIL